MLASIRRSQSHRHPSPDFEAGPGGENDCASLQDRTTARAQSVGTEQTHGEAAKRVDLGGGPTDIWREQLIERRVGGRRKRGRRKQADSAAANCHYAGSAIVN
jgi:hypothetical protein